MVRPRAKAAGITTALADAIPHGTAVDANNPCWEVQRRPAREESPD